ncbi:MAG: ABC transporter substrate-binding protein [Candidatus Delongbacteria bacterium]|nr:ABC transporter substrate-binding protein [Candidatus Delongbacteria bacterium]MCG2761509.1 ABC transporter substrate-binding protein [Candidatus Delongbacteria bacterium]
MKSYFMFIILFCAQIYCINLDKVKNLYDSGYYPELINFTIELEESPQNNLPSALYRGIAFYKMHDYRESKKLFHDIIEKSDDSNVKDYAMYYLALSEIKLDELVESALILTRLLNSSKPNISENSRTLLETLIYYKLTEDDYNDIIKKTFDKDVLSYIEQSKNALKILAVLPLSGIDKDAGKDILSGLEFAVKSLNTKGKKIKLDIVNSEGKITTMTKKVLDRLNSSRYSLIVGELRSDATAALAGISTLKNIPLLSPTASAKDISEISEYVFQLNTTSYTLGKTIAEFAIDSLNYKTFAVLAPMTEDGNESVSGFIEKVIEKGCAIISTEWYFETFDLNKQLQRIRERILTIDSLDTEEYMSSDSIKTVPAGIVDAFFLPTPNPDIESVLSQVSYYNFKANTLGTYGWDDLKMLNKLSTNADSLVFIKESSYGVENSKYNDFVYKFKNSYNRNPKILEIAGYSLMEMLTSLQNDNLNKSIMKILSELKEYDSIFGKIKFRNSRSNHASNIFMFSTKKGIQDIFFIENTYKDTLENAKKLFNTAYIYDISKKYLPAVNYYNESLQDYKKNLNLPDSLFDIDNKIIEIYKRLGISYYNLKDFNNAQIYFAKILNIYPDNKDIIFKNAVAISINEPDIALNILENFTNDPLFSSDAYLELGNIYLEQNEMKRAIDYYEISAELKNKKAIKILNTFKEQNSKKDEINLDW